MYPATDQTRASVIIPNWNGVEHLPECLNSLAGQSFRGFEVVVVDNGSSDDSVRLLERDYPWVRLIACEHNHGFSAAVNRGIEATGSQYVVLLNNDTRAEPDWLERLVAAMDAEPRASFAASKMLRYDPPHRIDSAGDRFSLFAGAGANIGAGEPADSHNQPAWVFGACAGAAIYRRSLFADIGLFDEDFFLIFEDVDIDLRAQVAGHRCLYVPDAVVYHKRGASTDLASTHTTARAWRNMIWVAGKNLPPLLLLGWVVAFLARLAWRLLLFVLRAPFRLVRGGRRRSGKLSAPDVPPMGERLSAYLAATGSALAALPDKRRNVSAVRRLGSLALVGILIRPVRPIKPVPADAVRPETDA